MDVRRLRRAERTEPHKSEDIEPVSAWDGPCEGTRGDAESPSWVQQAAGGRDVANRGVRRLSGLWLGRRAYGPVLALQHELREQRKAGLIGDTVLFVEHEPVITLGRGSKAEHLLVTRETLERHGIEVFETGRGGDVTLHAPGQLVCYPILDLAPDRCDVRRYVRDLTETMRRVAQGHGVESGPIERYVGLWADTANPGRWPGQHGAEAPAKLGAIGVAISRWITLHGFALNLSTDLDLFRLIVPCGIGEYGVTSIQALTGRAPGVLPAARTALGVLAEVLGAEIERDLDSEPLRDDEYVAERRAP
jgi:lipoyl(octanoyl) transferase